MNDVLYAYAQGCRDLSEECRRWFDHKGVAPSALGWDARRRLFKLRMARVRVDGRWFEFADEGSVAIVMVCCDEDGEVADLAAWCLGAQEVHLWHDRVAMLGEETCGQARVGDRLLVRDGVLDWLLHDRDGIVILNFDRAMPILFSNSPLSVSSKRMRRYIFSKWQIPRVEVSN
jgi:hypothetical protein